jgi:uncharacterized membrane protein
MALSGARLGKHPIHPMLVVLPLGLWVAALAFDILYAFTGNPAWRTAAFERVGVEEEEDRRRQARQRRVA